MWIYKLFLSVSVFASVSFSYAQVGGLPSPEAEQMYRQAREYTRMGNYADAITTYKQLLLLAPGKTALSAELGNVYLLSADYAMAEQTVEPLLGKTDATEQIYRIMAASQLFQKHYKRAKVTVRDGLTRFPSSGLLYHERGAILKEQKKQTQALEAWINGIVNAPLFAPNYKIAAEAFLGTDEVLWGLLYGETYLSMKHDTDGDDAFKRLLYLGWGTYFKNLAKTNLYPQASVFESKVNGIYTGLTPVVSDGLSTENLVMVHTRFFMEWFGSSAKPSPFSLFSYQNDLIRNGLFDIYIEYLYGAAENTVQFDGWNKFHTGDMERFLSWKKDNFLIPSKGWNALRYNINAEKRK